MIAPSDSYWLFKIRQTHKNKNQLIRGDKNLENHTACIQYDDQISTIIYLHTPFKVTLAIWNFSFAVCFVNLSISVNSYWRRK